MRLLLDPAMCDGFGFCAAILPERISLDEWGFPIIQSELSDAEGPAARAAVRCCPRRALRLAQADRAALH